MILAYQNMKVKTVKILLSPSMFLCVFSIILLHRWHLLKIQDSWRSCCFKNPLFVLWKSFYLTHPECKLSQKSSKIKYKHLGRYSLESSILSGLPLPYTRILTTGGFTIFLHHDTNIDSFIYIYKL